MQDNRLYSSKTNRVFKKNKSFVLLSACFLFLSTSLTACAAEPKPEPVDPKAGLRLVLNEEFDGKRLNINLFNCGLPWDGPNNPDNGNLNVYENNAVQVIDGQLRLWARKPAKPIIYKDDRRFAYGSGMVQTSTSYAFQYGYIETRAKMPYGKGLWGAFWLLPANPVGKWPPEIDIMEHHGDKPSKVYLSLHFNDASGEAQHEVHEKDVADITTDYHTYGVLWEPTRIVWFMDGEPLAETRDNIPQEPMYILLNLAVGGHWPGFPDESTPFPASMDIDYIRVWQY